jgi:hypothetical protein
VAGNGTIGYSGDGGAATSAQLNYPTGVAVDGSGNIYIADLGNSVIRKVSTSGTISTVAGNGTYNYSGDGGAATSAELAYPEGVVVDGSGNIYIADSYNQRIREVSAAVVVPSITSFTPTTAATGTTVTITGTGFTGATAVTFGGVAATSFTVVSSTSITAVVASGSSGSVSVTTGGGTATKAGFTYTIPPTTNTWTGATSTDWSVATNWSNNVLPTATSSVTIPSTPANQPLLPTNITVSGIAITGTLDINGKSLTINGAVTGTGSLVGSSTSSLIIGGNVGTLNFSPSGNSLKDLTINGTATLGNALNLYGTLTSTSGTLTTGGNLTLKSVSTGTAVVAPVSGTISGVVNIERYIPQGYAAFRDLGVCVSGAGTLANTWGQSLNFDYTYNYSAATGWSTVSNNTPLAKYTGYRVLVLGYKNSFPTTTISYMNSAVTLGYSGTLLTGNQNIPLTPGVNNFSFVSNPYASQVDFAALTTSGIYGGYWYLDPTILYGTYENYDYFGVDLGPSNIYGSVAGEFLQPGQAFFVCSNSSSPSLTFTENAKNNSHAQAAIFGATTPLNRIATGLFTGGKNVDGAVVVFNSKFSNGVSQEDGLKISNHGENLTFVVAGKDLCANGWTMPTATDELPLHLYNLDTNTAYTLRLDASQFNGNGLSAYIKDNVLGEETLLVGDSNIVAFSTTTDTARYSNRYSIVFSPGALPVKSISLTATELQDKQAAIKWSVIGGSNVANYKVERSTDGTTFTDLATVSPASSSNYSYVDASSPLGVGVYYRIKATDNLGILSYSNVAKLATDNLPPTTIVVYPNPVVNNSFNLGLGNAATGKYSIELVDKLGQKVFGTTLNHTVSTALENVSLGKQLAAGSYTVVARGEDGKVSSTEIIIK